MLNQLCIVSTEFRERDGESSYGYRIFDNYDKTYFNGCDLPLNDDMQVLKFAIENDKQFLIDYFDAQIEKSGIEINDTLIIRGSNWNIF